ncbi:TPA: hypothetical protein M1I42_003514 [Salmonella enterica subsp. salamae serovar 42:r:-]|nr:hypothetical protein [Salmonella enterica subsp. salamae serovar 42:r:-]
MDLNAKIIANQNKLDSINQEISKNTLPFARPTLGSNGFQGLDLSSANSILSGKNLAKLNWGQGINWPNLNSASLQTVSDIASGLNSVSHNSNDEKKNK